MGHLATYGALFYILSVWFLLKEMTKAVVFFQTHVNLF
jgi:hypothetical protein